MRLIASHYTSNVGRCHNIRSSWPPMKGWKSKSWEFTNSPTLKLSVLLLILTLTTPPKVAQHKSKSLRVPKLEKVWKYLIQIVEYLIQIVEYVTQIVHYLKQIAEYLKNCLCVLGSYCTRAHINHQNHRAFVERAHWPLKAGRNAYFQIFEMKVLRGNMFLFENGTLSRCAIFQFLRKKLKRTNLAPLKQSFWSKWKIANYFQEISNKKCK